MNLRDHIAKTIYETWEDLRKDLQDRCREIADAILSLIDAETGFVVVDRCPNTVFHLQIDEDIETGKCGACDGTGQLTRPLTFEEMKEAFGIIMSKEGAHISYLYGKTIKRKEVPMK
jgi:hypothetical protein